MTGANSSDAIGNDNVLVANTWVRILADSGAGGVWGCDGAEACAEDLPIGQGLIDRLDQWQMWHDREENAHGIFSGDVRAFSNEGRKIARAIKAALPDWTVMYFDLSAANAARTTDPRAVFEYEV